LSDIGNDTLFLIDWHQLAILCPVSQGRMIIYLHVGFLVLQRLGILRHAFLRQTGIRRKYGIFTAERKFSLMTTPANRWYPPRSEK
jgi:hypothetical protein